jgi:quinol monooxygenase YgiN
MMIVHAQVQIRPECREAFLAAARAVIPQSRQEAGFLEYGFFQDIDDPNRFITFERWASAAALSAHFHEPHTLTLLQKAPEMVASAPVITAYEAGMGRAVP